VVRATEIVHVCRQSFGLRRCTGAVVATPSPHEAHAAVLAAVPSGPYGDADRSSCDSPHADGSDLRNSRRGASAERLRGGAPRAGALPHRPPRRPMRSRVP